MKRKEGQCTTAGGGLDCREFCFGNLGRREKDAQSEDGSQSLAKGKDEVRGGISA